MKFLLALCLVATLAAAAPSAKPSQAYGHHHEHGHTSNAKRLASDSSPKPSQVYDHHHKHANSRRLASAPTPKPSQAYDHHHEHGHKPRAMTNAKRFTLGLPPNPPSRRQNAEEEEEDGKCLRPFFLNPLMYILLSPDCLQKRLFADANSLQEFHHRRQEPDSLGEFSLFVAFRLCRGSYLVNEGGAGKTVEQVVSPDRQQVRRQDGG
jgi:hypothetical protein